MRKFMITGMAVAMLSAVALPSVASADVQRHQEQTVTFTAIQPAQEYNQWSRLWTHDFTVSTNPCDGSFSGTGEVSGDDQYGTFDQQVPHTGGVDETITGKFVNGAVTLTATRPDGVVWDLVSAPMDNTTTSVATLSNHGSILSTEKPVEFKVSAPKLIGSTSYKNHGEFVKQSPDKNDAAHSCIGMPINSGK